MRISSVPHLYEVLPENERHIVDILRQIIKQNLPADSKEKISYNVPYFYRKRGICIIWPSAIPGGGVKEGVLLGFWYGNRIQDRDNFLMHGTNKRIYYKTFKSIHEIDQGAIIELLNEAVLIDNLASMRNSG